MLILMSAPVYADDLQDGLIAYERKDYKTALEKFKPLAAQGDDGEVQLLLASLYANGKGVAQDYVQALKWFTIAGAQGNKVANIASNILQKQMTPDQINEAFKFAREWSNKYKVKKDAAKWPASARYFDYRRRKVSCPKSANVILVTGQSNSANSLLSLEYKNNLHVNYLYGNCYVLDNPVLGATGNLNSITPAIASKLSLKTPYIFLTTGWAGTSITSWSLDNSELSGYTNHHLKELEKLGSKLSAVVWIQGEADAYSKINYKYHFKKMKTNVLRDLSIEHSVKFLITQTSICQTHRDRHLNKQQMELGNEENTYVTEVTDNLGNSFRYDKCHFNELGTEAIAKELSSILNDVLRD